MIGSTRTATDALWVKRNEIESSKARLEIRGLIAFVAAAILLITGLHFDEPILYNSAIPVAGFAIAMRVYIVRLSREGEDLLRQIRERI